VRAAGGPVSIRYRVARGSLVTPTLPALPPPFRFAPRTGGAAAHALRADRCAALRTGSASLRLNAYGWLITPTAAALPPPFRVAPRP